MECSICRTDMNVVSFETNTSGVDIPLNESVIRLKCGHAFHSMCIALTLRTNSTSCPMCRSPSEETASRRIILTLDDTDAIVELPSPEEMQLLETMNITLRNIRTKNTRIQQVRHEVNQEKKQVQELIQRLQKTRANCLKETIQEFRKEHRSEWENQKRKLQRKLNILRDLEYNALIQEVGTDAANDIIEKLAYDTDSILAGAQPLRKTFWTR